MAEWRKTIVGRAVKGTRRKMSREEEGDNRSNADTMMVINDESREARLSIKWAEITSQCNVQEEEAKWG
jgi:hypothetical protein